ncbi:uncharacterized protein LOC142615156 [Castanea sativa]|uniref:uncharacterized protein LOC142615156 n=1 Tax=Castanea sativa TaxID=21020 RepID=UPI003F64F9AC
MSQDGSINWDSPPRYDATPHESDDADDDADEMVQDYVADLPLDNQYVLLDSSINWDSPPRYDATPDESDDADDDADEMVEDYVAGLPLACQICFTNARNMAFLCGHTTCVECGERLDTCHICREPISYRIRLFWGDHAQRIVLMIL